MATKTVTFEIKRQASPMLRLRGSASSLNGVPA